MAVRIRMKRTGGKNKPCYRIVVADARSQRDGKVIETLGFYDPRHDTEQVNTERADYWISVGAQASETVAGVIKRAKGETTVKKATVKKVEQEVKPETKEETK
ncbi:MAG: 30S ribosomal protein S16 [bacterium]|nr:30S ribosomal protein S16 [bacterium]